MKFDRKTVLFIIIGCAVAASLVTVDLVVKNVAFDTLAGQPDVVVIPGFWSFRLATNYDIGFSLLRFLDDWFEAGAKRVFIIILQMLAIAAMVFLYFVVPKKVLPKLSGICLMLVVSGGLGNVLDRIFRGYVVDYVMWYAGSFVWPIFNLADVYTVVGVSLFLLMTFLGDTKKSSAQKVK